MSRPVRPLEVDKKLTQKEKKREYNRYYYMSKKIEKGGFYKSIGGINGLRKRFEDEVNKQLTDHIDILERSNEKLIGTDLRLRQTIIETIQTYLGMLSKCNKTDAIEKAITLLPPFEDEWDAKDTLDWYLSVTDELHKKIKT